jgi:hypothetical protein
VEASKLPKGAYKEITVRFVELKHDDYIAEGKKDDYAHLDQRRRGIMCIRVNRRVSGFLTFGEKLDDWSNPCRMEVTFPPSLDSEMGVRTQKQIDSKLNNVDIQNALRVLWHVQLTERIRIRKSEMGMKDDAESVVSAVDSVLSAPESVKKAGKKKAKPTVAPAPLPSVIELIAPTEVEAMDSRGTSPVADTLSSSEESAERDSATPPVLTVLPPSPCLRPSPTVSPPPPAFQNSVQETHAPLTPPPFNIADHFSLTLEQIYDCAEETGCSSELVALIRKIMKD